MSRGPFLHAIKDSGYDGERQFVDCTCGAQFYVEVGATAHYHEHLRAIERNSEMYRWHQGVAAVSYLEKGTQP